MKARIAGGLAVLTLLSYPGVPANGMRQTPVRFYKEGGVTTAQMEALDESASTTMLYARYIDSDLIQVDTDSLGEGGGSLTASLPDTNVSRAVDKVFVWDTAGAVTPVMKPISIGHKVMLGADFDNGVPLMLVPKDNVLKKSIDGGNAVLHFGRGNGNDFHADAYSVYSAGDLVVYQMDIKLLDAASTFVINLKDEGGSYSQIASVSRGVFSAGGTQVTFKKDAWYRISALYNYHSRTKKVYVANEKEFPEQEIEQAFRADDEVQLLRIHVPQNGGAAEFYVDNIFVYDGVAPAEELPREEREAIISGRSVFESDAPQAAMLEGYVGIHRRSGVTYGGGDKKIVDVFEENDYTFIPAEEFFRLAGVSYNDGMQIIEKSSFTQIKRIGNVYYVPVSEELAELFDLTLYLDDSAVNGGMAILGRELFRPQENEIQRLNDFLFYLRPSAEDVLSNYQGSNAYGQHPRIQATQQDFTRIRREIQTNWDKMVWSNRIISRATGLLSTDPVVYELRDGVRLLYVARDVLNNMYTLGMAYQITGEQKYADRAYLDLEAVSGFSDWHPSHHIDVGEMCAAVAVGYDWMYEAFTPEQRQVVEKGFYRNGLYEAVQAYESVSSLMTNAAVVENNHNIVCNGGIAMAALAFLDVYPELCAHLAANAMRGVEYMLPKFAPEGAWYEGAHYWEYAMQYTAKMFSALQSTLGSALGLEACQGLSMAGEYILHMQSPLGLFNYGDGAQSKQLVPELFYLARQYQNPGLAQALMTLSGGEFDNVEDIVLSLLWYNTSTAAGEVDLPTYAWYESEGTAVMRDSWSGSEITYTGVHAGYTNVPHGHLDGGSFIFESQGVRWALDLGWGDYNLAGYWETGENGKRWTMYRNRAESHNTIVVNPGNEPDHKVNSYAPITRFQANDSGGIAVVDMTDILHDVQQATRGFYFCDGKKSLVIRDEVVLEESGEVYWFMTTHAQVQFENGAVVLKQNGRKMKMELITSIPGEISWDTAGPLHGSPVAEGDVSETATRIALRVQGSGSVNITVKLTPYGIQGSDVGEYDKEISSWDL